MKRKKICNEEECRSLCCIWYTLSNFWNLSVCPFFVFRFLLFLRICPSSFRSHSCTGRDDIFLSSLSLPMSEVDPNAMDEVSEQEFDADKIKLLPGSSEDGTAATFQIIDEDHTLGNTLRYVIMKNPEVEFCGYSIPHPSENKMNIRIQTYGNISSVEALHQGLDNLSELCTVIETKFSEKILAGGYLAEEP